MDLKQKVYLNQLVKMNQENLVKKKHQCKDVLCSWCGHSNKAKPEFDKVINNNNNTKMDDVHCIWHL